MLKLKSIRRLAIFSTRISHSVRCPAWFPGCSAGSSARAASSVIECRHYGCNLERTQGGREAPCRSTGIAHAETRLHPVQQYVSRARGQIRCEAVPELSQGIGTDGLLRTVSAFRARTLF